MMFLNLSQLWWVYLFSICPIQLLLAFFCVSLSLPFIFFCIFRRVVFSSILLLLLRARLRRCLFLWNVRSTDRDLRWMSLTEAGSNFTFTRTTVLLSREKYSSASSSSLNRASEKNQSVFLSPKKQQRILSVVSDSWRNNIEHMASCRCCRINNLPNSNEKKSTTADLEIIHSRSFWWWWLLLIVRPGHRCSWCFVVMYG